MKTLTKQDIKNFSSLRIKKYRLEKGLFIVEGEKIVKELLTSDFNIYCIIATEQWYSANFNLIDNCKSICYITNKKDIDKLSSLSTPQEVLAIVVIPNYKLDIKLIKNELIIMLDSIQDPGNLGTIIRMADWFGINNIICSTNTVDFYNPKVVQATMGSFIRVKVHYCNLIDFLEEALQNSIPVWGTFLDGESVYETKFPNNGILVMGNESKGISREIEKLVQKRITIPNFSRHENKPESLNVAIATSIIISLIKSKNTVNYK